MTLSPITPKVCKPAFAEINSVYSPSNCFPNILAMRILAMKFKPWLRIPAKVPQNKDSKKYLRFLNCSFIELLINDIL